MHDGLSSEPPCVYRRKLDRARASPTSVVDGLHVKSLGKPDLHRRVSSGSAATADRPNPTSSPCVQRGGTPATARMKSESHPEPEWPDRLRGRLGTAGSRVVGVPPGVRS